MGQRTNPIAAYRLAYPSLLMGTILFDNSAFSLRLVCTLRVPDPEFMLLSYTFNL